MADRNTYEQRRTIYLDERKPARLGEVGPITHLGTFFQEIDNREWKALANQYNFLTIAQKNKRVVKDTEFVIDLKDYRPAETYTQWNAGGALNLTAAADATLPIPDTTYEPFFVSGATFWIDSPSVTVAGVAYHNPIEIICTADADSAAHTVAVRVRQATDTNTYALAQDVAHRLFYTGSSWADGTGYPTGISEAGSQSYNVTEIFKRVISEHGVLSAPEWRLKADKFEMRKDGVQEQFILDMQTNMLLSRVLDRGTAALPRRKCMGLNGMLTSNRWRVTGDLTERGLWQMMKSSWKRQDRFSSKFGLTTSWGKLALMSIMTEKHIFVDRIDKDMGLEYTEWQTPFGKINLVVNDYYYDLNWRLDSQMTNDSRWDGQFLMLFDQSMLEWITLNGRGLRWQPNVQLPGWDLKIDLLWGEHSIAYNREDTGAIICWRSLADVPDVSAYSTGTGDHGATNPYAYHT